ncbi:MAG: hypothetical protein ACKVX9_08885 [Blastocatellia bacterium]
MVDRRLATLEKLVDGDREILRENRERLWGMIPNIMRKYGKTEAEARELVLITAGPEEAALLADDWETNPATLDFLRTLRQPNGNDLIFASGLRAAAKHYGVPFEDLLCQACLAPDVELEAKLLAARIAKTEGLTAVMLVLNPAQEI